MSDEYILVEVLGSNDEKFTARLYSQFLENTNEVTLAYMNSLDRMYKIGIDKVFLTQNAQHHHPQSQSASSSSGGSVGGEELSCGNLIEVFFARSAPPGIQLPKSSTSAGLAASVPGNNGDSTTSTHMATTATTTATTTELLSSQAMQPAWWKGKVCNLRENLVGVEIFSVENASASSSLLTADGATECGPTANSSAAFNIKEIVERQHVRLVMQLGGNLKSNLLMHSIKLPEELLSYCEKYTFHNDLKKWLGSPILISFEKSHGLLKIFSINSEVIRRAKMIDETYIRMLRQKMPIKLEKDDLTKRLEFRKQKNEAHPTLDNESGLFMLSFVVQEDLMGLSIGTQGSNIQAAREIEGVTSVLLNNETCTFCIYGKSEEAVKAARQKLEFVREVSFVPADVVSRLIGKSGRNIQEILAKSRVLRVRILESINELYQFFVDDNLQEVDDNGDDSRRANRQHQQQQQGRQSTITIRNLTRDDLDKLSHDQVPMLFVGSPDCVKDAKMLLEFSVENLREMDKLELEKEQISAEIQQNSNSHAHPHHHNYHRYRAGGGGSGGGNDSVGFYRFGKSDFSVHQQHQPQHPQQQRGGGQRGGRGGRHAGSSGRFNDSDNASAGNGGGRGRRGGGSSRSRPINTETKIPNSQLANHEDVGGEAEVEEAEESPNANEDPSIVETGPAINLPAGAAAASPTRQQQHQQYHHHQQHQRNSSYGGATAGPRNPQNQQQREHSSEHSRKHSESNDETSKSRGGNTKQFGGSSAGGGSAAAAGRGGVSRVGGGRGANNTSRFHQANSRNYYDSDGWMSSSYRNGAGYYPVQQSYYQHHQAYESDEPYNSHQAQHAQYGHNHQAQQQHRRQHFHPGNTAAMPPAPAYARSSQSNYRRARGGGGVGGGNNPVHQSARSRPYRN